MYMVYVYATTTHLIMRYKSVLCGLDAIHIMMMLCLADQEESQQL